MALPSKRPRFAVARPVRDILRFSLPPGLALLMVACGGTGAPPPPAASVSAAVHSTPAPQAREGSITAEDDAAARGERALREQRLFLPAGDNAFEHFLAAVEARPADERSRLALDDLLPYAALHVEQRLAAEALEDAERMLDLMARASAEAPALPRLRSATEALRERLAGRAGESSASRPRPAIAPPSAAATAAEPVAALATPPSTAAPSPDLQTAAPAVTSIVAPAEPAPDREALATAVASNIGPRPVAARRVPEVEYRPPLRYPALAERRKLEGFVEIEFTIGADGSVSELEVLLSQPEGVFEREALAAMQRWRFAPPAEPMRARRTLEFRLTRGSSG